MTAYQDFALLYDELMDDIDYYKWFNYIKDIFKKCDKSPKSILEMACGTGNLTKYFCEERYDVTCFDLSDDMLSIAYDKLGSFKNVNIIKQDMVTLNLSNKKFDSIICACDSINYVTDKNDLLKVFENAYNHLSDDGLFIFDINSYYKLKNIIGENTFVQDREDIFYVWENEFIEEDEVCNFYLTFFVKEDEMYERFDEVHIEKAYKNEDILNYLKRVKFKEVFMYDNFTFDDPQYESERIFFVARK
ncbi:putative methyltransferase type 12 [Gottschalkia acidurici 9a]|uniref:Methyltransferase type 12 n=1 Tax=Gottschalkia acidurici (strain ATCC 7906 / DSM 604 / BCRC 14475 / CIP 104303 / KCTC 5404 / NCIMB 10678 / 9a) TaxID=1128398 RepID=K0AYR5_GOTA9|nr:class I SAM-dependent methyltransferase [Gottschalkia acidurici]AFS77917.1 putative methyltransferase type 12 [Gottschalkia acidurici 9a]